MNQVILFANSIPFNIKRCVLILHPAKNMHQKFEYM